MKEQKPKKFSIKMQKKLLCLYALIILAFILLSVRLSWIVKADGATYEKQVLSQQNYSSETLPYKRGDILDRDGNILATSQKMYTLILEPKNILRSDKIQKETINALHKYMKIDKDELLKLYLGNNNSPCSLKIYNFLPGCDKEAVSCLVIHSVISNSNLTTTINHNNAPE